MPKTAATWMMKAKKVLIKITFQLHFEILLANCQALRIVHVYTTLPQTMDDWNISNLFLRKQQMNNTHVRHPFAIIQYCE